MLGVIGEAIMESADLGMPIGPVKCPKCNGVMERGAVAVKDTLGGLFIAGFSQQSLFFIHADADRTFLMSSGQTTEAYWCATCKTVVAQYRRAGGRRKPRWYVYSLGLAAAILELS
jgi:hypothetical protein